MEKMTLMRSLYRTLSCRSLGISASAAAVAGSNHVRHLQHNPSLPSSRSAGLSSRSAGLSSGFESSFGMRVGSRRHFCEGLSHMPTLKDPDILNAFKDLMAMNWDELSPAVVYDAKHVLSKKTDDKDGQEVLANVFRAAEAVEEFTGILVSLKMEIDDSIGLSGEDVKALPEDFSKALQIVYSRYVQYLDAFGPEEGYLKKKVESEVGTRLIHLKMRCSGLGPEWGKVTVLGTSGMAGSYVEQRA